MIKVKNNAQVRKIEDKTIKLAKMILNDAIASKQFTSALIRKGYKIKEVANPKHFVMRRLRLPIKHVSP